MAKKTSSKRPVDASKLSIWKAFVASGGRVAEVAAQYGITPADVEKIVREVEDSFHAPLNDPKTLLKQFSLLNEAVYKLWTTGRVLIATSYHSQAQCTLIWRCIA